MFGKNKKKIDFVGVVTDEGRLPPDVSRLIAEALRKVKGRRIKITIEEKKKDRSSKENKYYFGCVVEEQIQCLYERFGVMLNRTQMHEINKRDFFCTEVFDEKTGEVLKIPGSSAELSTEEFEQKMEQMRRYYHEMYEWYIPLPNEQKQLF